MQGESRLEFQKATSTIAVYLLFDFGNVVYDSKCAGVRRDWMIA